MNSRVAQIAVLSALACFAAACASMKPLPMPDRPKLAFKAVQTHAGIEEVDITPPLGLGMFGHGPDGRIAAGTQLRLHCQVFVIIGAAPAGQTSKGVVLVPCDLSAPTLLLQRAIAKHVADHDVPIDANAILIMATHTHAAPGNFYGTTNYTGPFSTRLIGFDQRVLDFLVDRIAGGIERAYRTALTTGVHLAWSQEALSETLSRNRDMDPLLHDREVPAWLKQRVKNNPEHPAEAAVDPTLSVLRIDRYVRDEAGARYEPYGLFATFGMHPTALSNMNTAYSGDVFGYASRYVSSVVRSHHGLSSFVVGIANGIEGDVSPNRANEGFREARRCGHLLADAIEARWNKLANVPDALDGTAAVHVAYRELVLPNARTKDGAKLCPRPELGVASAGGAADHPTLMRVFPQANPGATTNVPGGCGFPKLPVLAIGGEMKGGVDFPGTTPVTVAQIGTHYIVTLPAEFTTVAGARLRDAVADELGLPAATDENVGRSVVVIGLTNEYLQYVTTRDEYPLQNYEGASNLWGPASADFFRDHAACLAHWLVKNEDVSCRLGQTNDVNRVSTIEYQTQPSAGLIADEREDRPAELTRGEVETKLTRDGLVELAVHFKGPRPEALRARANLWIDVRSGEDVATSLDDDRGTTVTTRYDYYAQEWIASFIPDLPRDRRICGHSVRVIVGSGDKRLQFGPITIDCSAAGGLSEVWP